MKLFLRWDVRALMNLKNEACVIAVAQTKSRRMSRQSAETSLPLDSPGSAESDQAPEDRHHQRGHAEEGDELDGR